jgi:DNA-binding SARP family transcriptional activator
MRPRPVAPARTSPYWAQFFGPFDVRQDGRPIARDALTRSGPRTLLKWFLLHPGTPVSVREVASLLWPARPAGSRAGRLHATLHQLRRSLEPDLAGGAESRFIRSDREGTLWFELAGCWDTDLRQAQRLLASAEELDAAGDLESATGAYERLVLLSSATFLPEDLYADQFQDVRAAHEVALGRARDRLLQLYLTQGLCHRALSFALAMQHQDPYSEVAALAIAQVHLGTGNDTAAARHIEDFIRLVGSDLGAAPAPQLLRLRDHIRSRAGRELRPAADRGRRPEIRGR